MNPDTHFYLYAKGHYVRSNKPIEDIKRIVAHRCGLKSYQVSNKDAINILSEVAFRELLRCGNPQYKFEELIWDLMQDGYIYDLTITALLRIPCDVKVKDLDLGFADKDVLPINQGGHD